MASEYRIISKATSNKLEAAVNLNIVNGWTPVGRIMIHPSNLFCYQAMVIRSSSEYDHPTIKR